MEYTQKTINRTRGAKGILGVRCLCRSQSFDAPSASVPTWGQAMTFEKDSFGLSNLWMAFFRTR